MIPEHWNYKEIEKIAFTYAGGTPTRTQSSMFGGSIPWVKSSELNLRDISDTEEKLTELGYSCSSTKWVPPNTPLIAMYGATAGVVSWLRIRALTNQAVLAVVPKSQETHSRWLYWILKFYSSQLIASVQGSGQPNLNKNLIDTLKVPYSPSLEQQKIAETLDQSDLYITHTENLIAKYQRIKTGLMQDLLTRGIDENGQLRDPKTHKFKPSPFGLIPDEWEFQPFSNHIDSSAFGPRFSAALYAENGSLAMIRTTDLDEEGNIISAALPLADLDPNQYSSHLLKQGDLLVTRSGTIGLTTVFESYELPTIPSAFMIRFRLRNSVIPKYYKYFFNSKLGKRLIAKSSAGGVQKNLKTSSISDLIVPIPSIEEQKRILEVLDSQVQGVLNDLLRLAKSKRTKLGLMQDLLKGEVSVEPLLTSSINSK